MRLRGRESKLYEVRLTPRELEDLAELKAHHMRESAGHADVSQNPDRGHMVRYAIRLAALFIRENL